MPRHAGRVVVPHVLADVDAEPEAAPRDHLALGRRLEVAHLVEHVVGGQERLGDARDDAVAWR